MLISRPNSSRTIQARFGLSSNGTCTRLLQKDVQEQVAATSQLTARCNRNQGQPEHVHGSRLHAVTLSLSSMPVADDCNLNE